MEALRKKIGKRINAGDKLKDIAERYDVNVKTVYKVRDMVKAGDTTFKDKKRSRRPRTTRTPAKIEEPRALIEANPLTSSRKLARELEVPETTVRNILKKDLKVKSLTKTRVQSLTAVQRQKCLERVKR